MTDLAKKRIEIYNALYKKLNRAPTKTEVAEAIHTSQHNALFFLRYYNLEYSRKEYGREYHHYVRDERISKYRKLCSKLGRLPTNKELCDCWGIRGTYLHMYIRSLKEAKEPFDIKIMSIDKRKNHHVIKHIRSVIAAIEKKHNMTPSIRELALLFGVSRQRIHQITLQLGLNTRGGQIIKRAGS